MDDLTKKNGLNESRIEARLRRIANVLLLNASFTDNLGLLNGKMGIAIFFYQYSKYSGNKIYSDYAGELIDEIYEEINTNTLVDFANGLTGIGWGIEYLVKNGYVEANTDEALAEIDKIIFQSSIDKPFLLNNSKDMFGYGLYFISRFRGMEEDNIKLSTYAKKENLLYLTDQLDRIAIQKKSPDFVFQSLSIDTVNSFTWFLIEIHRLGLSLEKVERLFHSLPVYIESCFQDSNDEPGLSLLIGLTENIITSITDEDLKKTFKTILKKKNAKALNIDLLEDVVVNHFAKKTWQQLIYKPDITGDKQFQYAAEKNCSIIDDEEIWSQQLDKLNKDNLGLTGIAGMGLGLIFEMEEEKSGVKEVQLEARQQEQMT